MPKHDSPPRKLSDDDKARVYRDVIGQLVADAGGRLRVKLSPVVGRLQIVIETDDSGAPIVDFVLITPRKAQ